MDPAQLAELKNAAEEGFARAQFNLALCNRIYYNIATAT